MHILAENTALSNPGPWHHMAKAPDLRPSANGTRLVDIPPQLYSLARHKS